jgi:hypothetical protein
MKVLEQAKELNNSTKPKEVEAKDSQSHHTSRGASLSEISKFVNVESMGARSQAFKISLHPKIVNHYKIPVISAWM